MKIIFILLIVLICLQEIFAQTSLYNSRVIKAERWKRPLASGVSAQWITYVVSHSGVVVTLENGQRWLVHKGDEYGNESQTVVVSTSYMSNQWSLVQSCTVSKLRTVSDYVAAGGATYSVFFDNCNHASTRMMNLC